MHPSLLPLSIYYTAVVQSIDLEAASPSSISILLSLAHVAETCSSLYPTFLFSVLFPASEGATRVMVAIFFINEFYRPSVSVFLGSQCKTSLPAWIPSQVNWCFAISCSFLLCCPAAVRQQRTLVPRRCRRVEMQLVALCRIYIVILVLVFFFCAEDCNLTCICHPFHSSYAHNKRLCCPKSAQRQNLQALQDYLVGRHLLPARRYRQCRRPPSARSSGWTYLASDSLGMTRTRSTLATCRQKIVGIPPELQPLSRKCGSCRFLRSLWVKGPGARIALYSCCHATLAWGCWNANATIVTLSCPSPGAAPSCIWYPGKPQQLPPALLRHCGPG